MASTPLRDLPEDVVQHFTGVARREGVSRNTVLVRVLTDAARRDRLPPSPPMRCSDPLRESVTSPTTR